VRDPEELTSAIDRCLAALDDGKAAVLHVHITRL
jgi:acetolactate synthase-1/2/3 large subunit